MIHPTLLAQAAFCLNPLGLPHPHRGEKGASLQPFTRRPSFWNDSLSLSVDCEWEVIVQGDEGPFSEVAQVVDCHGVTVGHQEREEEEVEQEVESDGEKTLKELCACPWMG